MPKVFVGSDEIDQPLLTIATEAKIISPEIAPISDDAKNAATVDQTVHNALMDSLPINTPVPKPGAANSIIPGKLGPQIIGDVNSIAQWMKVTQQDRTTDVSFCEYKCNLCCVCLCGPEVDCCNQCIYTSYMLCLCSSCLCACTCPWNQFKSCLAGTVLCCKSQNQVLGKQLHGIVRLRPHYRLGPASAVSLLSDEIKSIIDCLLCTK